MSGIEQWKREDAVRRQHRIQADYQKRITELEQENKTLREALLEAAKFIENDCFGTKALLLINKLKAIAQNKEL